MNNFSVLFLLFLTQTIFAQIAPALSVDLAQATQQRVALDAADETEICGLQIGYTYTLQYVGDTNPAAGFLQTNGNPSQKITHFAAAECASFTFAPTAADASTFLSIACIDCPQMPTSAGLSDLLLNLTAFPESNASTLVEDVFIGGDCYSTSNAVVTGDPLSVGIFAGAESIFNFADGIVLSTGYISGMGQPSTDFISSDTDSPTGDPDLSAISGGIFANDVVILEFDFVPTAEVIGFEYTFASEEYCDFAPPNTTSFNDAFGFFLSGPGLDGPYANNAVNIALLPDGQDVSINNVNPVTNAPFFVSNGSDCGTNGPASNLFAFDGYTTSFTAFANVVPCETYHIKLAVGDGGDQIFDSAVFLKANRFDAGGGAETAFTVPETGGTNAYESGNCSAANVRFTRLAGDVGQDEVIEFEVSGTATPGVDYAGMPSSPITIPAGAAFLEYPLTVIDDDVNEGVETIEIQTFNQCTCDDAQTTLQIFDYMEMSVTVSEPQLCDNLADTVLITAEVSGGLPGYLYDWGDGATTDNTHAVITASETGYALTVTDACGAEITISETVAVADTEAVLTGEVSLCGGIENGTLSVEFSGTAGPYTLLYSIDGTAQPAITGVTQNPYLLNVTAGGNYVLDSVYVNGCAGSTSGAVFVAGTEASWTSEVTHIACAGENTGIIDLILDNPADETVTFNWSNGSTTEDLTGLAAGEYAVTATAGGCPLIETFILTENEPLTAAITGQPVDCSANIFGNIDLTVGGGAGSYTFAWSNGAVSQDPTDLIAGSYTVTVTDAAGCTAEQTVEVTETNGSFLNLGAVTIQNIGCHGEMNGGFALNQAGGEDFTYEWSENVGVQTGNVLTDLAAGTYSVTVSNSVGCLDYLSFPVSEPAPLLLTPNHLDATCFGAANGTLALAASGGTAGGDCPYTYTVSPALPDNNGCGLYTNVPAGDYTALVTDNNGCTDTQTITVQQPTEIILNIAVSGASCAAGNDGILNVTATGGAPGGDCGYSYVVEPNLPTASCGLFANAAAGIYTVSVTDATGCTVVQTAEVPQGAEIQPTLTTADVTCPGAADGVLTVTATGGSPEGDCAYTYSVEPSLTEQSCGVFVGAAAGVYTVMITDAEGCTATQTTEILQPNAIEINLTASPVTCNATDDGTLTATATGGSPNAECGYTYSVEPSLNEDGCGVFIGATAGIYTLTVTDTNGCTATQSAEVTQAEELILGVTNILVSCAGAGDGIVTASATGGNPLADCPYTYSIEPALPSVDCGVFAEAGPGVYAVTAEDAAGCQLTVFTEVAEPAELTAELTAVNITCPGGTDGAANIDITGGTAPYAGETFFENVPAGDYTTTVTDAAGCEISIAFALTQPDSLTFTADPQNASTGSSNDGSITLSDPTGGTAPYDYLWSSGDETQNLTDAAAGDYTLQITDAAGCLYEYAYTIEATTAINEIAAVIACSLVPNPVRQGDAPYLLLDVSENKELTVQVISTAGRVVSQKRVAATAGENRIKTTAEDLPAGVWFLRVQAEGGEAATLRIVVL